MRGLLSAPKRSWRRRNVTAELYQGRHSAKPGRGLCPSRPLAPLSRRQLPGTSRSTHVVPTGDALIAGCFSTFPRPSRLYPRASWMQMHLEPRHPSATGPAPASVCPTREEYPLPGSPDQAHQSRAEFRSGRFLDAPARAVEHQTFLVPLSPSRMCVGGFCTPAMSRSCCMKSRPGTSVNRSPKESSLVGGGAGVVTTCATSRTGARVVRFQADS